MSDEPPEPGPTVVVFDERAAPGVGPEVDADRWGRLAADVLVAEHLDEPRIELTVHFVDEQPIADLSATTSTVTAVRPTFWPFRSTILPRCPVTSRCCWATW